MAHLNGHLAHDDVSLIAVDCPRVWQRKIVPGDREQAPHLSLSSQALQGKSWRIGLRLSAAELKTLDILPFLMEWVTQVKVDSKQRGQIFLILSELFTNALDHGMLGLGSSLKSNLAEGFECHLAERAARLAALATGFIEIEIEPSWQPEGEVLQLRVKDSGNGFDYARMLNTDIATSTARSGRGIALLRDLCSRVTYLGNGNEVVAYYRLS
jgi:anti-sigma regulatory factor (Ser/Thr protein kinase)